MTRTRIEMKTVRDRTNAIEMLEVNIREQDEVTASGRIYRDRNRGPWRMLRFKNFGGEEPPEFQPTTSIATAIGRMILVLTGDAGAENGGGLGEEAAGDDTADPVPEAAAG